MVRTEKGPVRKWVDELLVELLRSAVSAWSLSLLLRLFSLQEVVLPTLGALVLASGIAYAVSLCLHRPRANRIAYRPLREAQATLARVWIGVGAILVVLGALSMPPVLLPLVGAVACWALYRRAGVLGTKQAHPRRGGKHPARVGALATAVLTIPVLLVSYTGFAYAGMEAVELYKHSAPSSGEGDGEGGDESGSASETDGEGDEEPTPPSYADLCPELPDPQQIGYGLGDLFEHDGAVAAGCGEPAERVGDSTWISAGYCGRELRSLAVVGEGREPVLVYGAPARFALAEAEAHALRFAEVGKLGGGEVVIAGTGSGTVSFARSSPALDPGHGDAVRCGEVDEVARPFAELAPPLTRLWLEYMAGEQEWAWPRPSRGSADVVFEAADQLPAYGSCEAELLCRLDGPGSHLVEEGPAEVTLNELEAYAPPAASDDHPSSSS